MSAVNNTVNNGFQKGLDIANFTVTTTEPLEKVTKVSFRAIDMFLTGTAKVSAPLALLSSRLKDTADVIEGVNTFGRIKELACPDDKGQYFLTNEKNRWQKCLDRIFLAAAGILKTINVMFKFSLINLGKFAKLTVGKLPVFRLIPDVFVAISASFSLWDNALNVKTIKKNIAVSNQKVEKWAKRSAQIEQIKNGNYADFIEFKNRYEEKVAKLKADIKRLEAAGSSKELSAKQAALKKYQDRLEKIEARDNIGLAADLAKQDIKFKQKKWSVIHHNECINRTKAALSITSAVGKIFVITMASTIFGIGLLTIPYTLSLLATGICVDSIGYSKCIYDKFAPVQTVPTKMS